MYTAMRERRKGRTQEQAAAKERSSFHKSTITFNCQVQSDESDDESLTMCRCVGPNTGKKISP